MNYDDLEEFLNGLAQGKKQQQGGKNEIDEALTQGFDLLKSVRVNALKAGFTEEQAFELVFVVWENMFGGR